MVRSFRSSGLVSALLVVCINSSASAQKPGELRGRVIDQLGGLVVGAAVVANFGGTYTFAGCTAPALTT